MGFCFAMACPDAVPSHGCAVSCHALLYRACFRAAVEAGSIIEQQLAASSTLNTAYLTLTSGTQPPPPPASAQARVQAGRSLVIIQPFSIPHPRVAFRCLTRLPSSLR
jgi:hypothetical protein